MAELAFPYQAIAQMQLRAPRIALVIPVTRDWHHTAMHAMHALTGVWGGAGFVIVPTKRGEVSPAMLSALREYDPDSVLQAPSDSITEEQSAFVEQAQARISAVCSNFRRPLIDPSAAARPAFSDLWNIWFNLANTQSSGDPTPLNSVTDPDEQASPIGANPLLSGSLGLAAACRWGLSQPPKKGALQLDGGVKRAAVRRLASYDHDAKGIAGVTTRDTALGLYETALSRTLFGLDGVQAFGPGRSDTLVVIGDAPDDFALAMAWDRTYRHGVWIPNEWWTDDSLRSWVVMAIDSLLRASSSALKRVLFTSTSLTAEDVQSRVGEWRSSTTSITDKDLDDKWSIVSPTELPRSRFWKVHYAVQDNYSHEWSTTVTNVDGTVAFSMLPPLPSIGVRNLERLEQSACWHVDVSLRDHALPPTTAVPEHALFTDSDEARPTRARVGRAGISFQALRTDFIPAGASLAQSLTRPLLRFPSLLEWANARVETYSMSARLSAAGVQANVLASMIGSRDTLADIVSGEYRPVFEAFNRNRSTKDDFPDGEGCVVNSEAFLHFSGICSIAGIAKDAEEGVLRARDTIDTLLRAGVLRRGLLTKCPVCQHSAFVHVDYVATNIRCQRCLADNPLERQLWRLPVEEPTWFYDLHPIARSLFKSNGDVPLMLSKYLRSTSKRYFSDAAEFEVIEESGNPVSETDLLALVDRRLSTAEAKSSSNFGGRKERLATARKRVLVARALVVDEIILATTASQWDENTLTAMKTAMREEAWPLGQPPVLRVISNLGGAARDETLSV